MCICGSYVSRTHDVIDDVTRSKNMWLTGHHHETLRFRFGFSLNDRRRSKMKMFSGIFKIHVLNMRVLSGLQIWKLHCRLCKTKLIWPRWRHKWRHSATLNIALWPISREWMRILYFWDIHDQSWFQRIRFLRSQIQGQGRRITRWSWH